MAEAARYLFERTFTATGAEPQKEAAREAALAAARAEGYAAGEAAGLAQARSETAAVAAGALERIVAQIAALGAAQRAALARHEREATALSSAIARKLVPTLMARMPEIEIAALVRRCLEHLQDEPRIVVRASVHASEALKTSIDEIAAKTGFPGHIVLLPDDALTGGDCRIEWADGGVERDHDGLAQQIDAAIDRFLRSQLEMTRESPDARAAGAPAQGETIPA